MNLGLLALIVIVALSFEKKGKSVDAKGEDEELPPIIYGTLQLRISYDLHWKWTKGTTYTVSASCRFFGPEGKAVLYSERGTAADKEAIIPWHDLQKVIDSKGNNYLRHKLDSYMEERARALGQPLSPKAVIESTAGELNKWASMVADAIIDLVGQVFGLPPGWTKILEGAGGGGGGGTQEEQGEFWF